MQRSFVIFKQTEIQKGLHVAYSLNFISSLLYFGTLIESFRKKFRMVLSNVLYYFDRTLLCKIEHRMLD